MAHGPARGLEIADRLVTSPALASYAHLPAVRGDLLAKLGRLEEAREEFGRAAALTGNERERAVFRARADACVIAVPARADPKAGSPAI
jgi:predicted RNA polymerase sigma factor